jgi:hypothetical protein
MMVLRHFNVMPDKPDEIAGSQDLPQKTQRAHT